MKKAVSQLVKANNISNNNFLRVWMIVECGAMSDNGKKIRGKKLRRREEGTLFFSAHISFRRTHNLNAWNKPMICVISASELKK